MDVANPGKHMVNHVEVEAPQNRGREPVAPGIVHGRVENVADVVVGNVALFISFGKRRFLAEMARLKGESEGKAEKKMHHDEPEDD
jgi:hypothetical protein